MIYAIGDIHGRSDHLLGALLAIKADARTHGIVRPRTVFLGDYIDRGNDSKGVLDLLTSPRMEEFDPVFLTGNHDLTLILILRGEKAGEWIFEGGAATVRSYGIETDNRDPDDYLAELRKTVPASHRRFLANLDLCHAEDGMFFSHAGIDPAFPLDASQPFEALVYGKRAFLEAAPTWDGCVVHGHWAKEKPVLDKNRACLDAGCGYPWGRLMVAAFENGTTRLLMP
jgi:serine/threonine protein phosphatase 1